MEHRRDLRPQYHRQWWKLVHGCDGAAVAGEKGLGTPHCSERNEQCAHALARHNNQRHLRCFAFSFSTFGLSNPLHIPALEARIEMAYQRVRCMKSIFSLWLAFVCLHGFEGTATAA